MIDLYLKTDTQVEMDAALLSSELFVEVEGVVCPVDAFVLMDIVTPPYADPPLLGYYVNLRLLNLDEVPEAFVAVQAIPETPWRVWA